MQHDTFIGLVQHRAELPSRGDAERITRIFLETLAEQLTEGAARHLAAQLPAEIGRHLIGTLPTGRLSLNEFFQRLSLREGMPLKIARHHAWAVMSVLREAVSPGALKHVRDQLPSDYAPLFEAEVFGEPPLSAQITRSAKSPAPPSHER